MKLDKIDEKVLSCVYHHYRDSVTDIAKACKISKEQAGYRLRKFEEEKLIIKYVTLYNYSLLGYNQTFIVWINCKNLDEIRSDLEKRHNILTYGDMLSKYDLFINFIYKSVEDFDKDFNAFIYAHKDNITGYNIFSVTHFELFDLKTLNIRERTFKISEYKNPIELNNSDKHVLKELEHDGRRSLVDIAKSTGISSVAILKKLRALKEKGIIQGVRALIDVEKLGFYWAEMHIKFDSITEDKKKKIIAFARAHKHVNLINFGIGEINCIIQILYHTENELRRTVRDVKERYKEDISFYSLILTENEGTVRTLPFKEFD